MSGDRVASTDGHYAVVSRIEGVDNFLAPHYRVELYDGNRDLSRPVAIAYMTDFQPMPGREWLGPVLDYLTVFEQHQGRGHARRLIRVLQARFPGIDLGERIPRDSARWRNLEMNRRSEPDP